MSAERATVREFSELIQKKMNSGLKQLDFLSIWWAIWASQEAKVYQRANAKIFYLKNDFFNTQMISTIFHRTSSTEHSTILRRNEPYHHEIARV